MDQGSYQCIVTNNVGSCCSYQFDKKVGTLVLKEILPEPFETNVGFLPQTIAENGEPIPVVVHVLYPLLPMSVVPCWPIKLNEGVLYCKVLSRGEGERTEESEAACKYIEAAAERYKFREQLRKRI